jgi:hypothetical protein
LLLLNTFQTHFVVVSLDRLRMLRYLSPAIVCGGFDSCAMFAFAAEKSQSRSEETRAAERVSV